MVRWVVLDSAYSDNRTVMLRWLSYAVLAGGIALMLVTIRLFWIDVLTARQFWSGLAVYVALLIVGAVLHNVWAQDAAARDDFRGFTVITHDDEDEE